jgi:hypothetical protein
MKGVKLLIAGLILICINTVLFAGKVVEVKGDAELMVNGSWTKAAADMTVADGTKVMTGVGGSIKIQAPVGYFIVNEMSIVTYSEKTSQGKADQSVSVDVGKIRVRYDKVAGIQSTFKVQTPKGTASVRGTEEDVGYYPVSGLKLDVIEGSVNIVDNNGNSFNSSTGESSGVSTGGDIYGESDVVQGDVGYYDSFGYDDTSNDLLKDFIDDTLHNEPALTEPEKL